MKKVGAVLVLATWVSGSGCFSARPSANDTFTAIAARNLVEQPIRHADDRKFTLELRKKAEEAFKCLTGGPYSHPYKSGFIEGFVDYVDAGQGEPPFLPPFRYRLSEHRTEEGIRMIEDWYAGFRHGAEVARASGIRELTLVPLPAPGMPMGDTRALPALPSPAVDSSHPLPLPRPIEPVSRRHNEKPVPQPQENVTQASHTRPATPVQKVVPPLPSVPSSGSETIDSKSAIPGANSRGWPAFGDVLKLPFEKKASTRERSDSPTSLSRRILLPETSSPK